MSNTPFYIINIENEEDISELVTKITYEDCIEEDDLLRLSLIDSDSRIVNGVLQDKSLELLDKSWLKRGTFLDVKWGWLGGFHSKWYRVKITNISVKYTPRISVEIDALDVGNSMKKTKSTKIWRNRTASQIINEIAQKHNLQTEITNTSFVYKNLPQGQQSDYQFIQYLCTQEENGSFEFFVKSNTLFFQKRDLGQKSKRTYTYKDGNDEIVSLSIDMRETQQQQSMGNANVSVQSASFDFLAGKEVNINETLPSVVKKDADFTKLADLVSTYDMNAELQKGSKQGKGRRVIRKTQSSITYINSRGQIESVPIKSTQKEVEEFEAGQRILATPNIPNYRLSNQTKHKIKSAAQKTLVANLKVIGDVSVEAGCIITLKKLSKKHSGNWRAIKVVHDIAPNSYYTSLELNRNAEGKIPSTQQVARSATTTKPVQSQNTGQGKVNKSVGTSKKTPERKIISYNANSNRVKK